MQDATSGAIPEMPESMEPGEEVLLATPLELVQAVRSAMIEHGYRAEDQMVAQIVDDLVQSGRVRLETGAGPAPAA